MTCSEDRLFGPHDYEIVYGWSARSLEVTISARTGPPLCRGDVCTIGGEAGIHCKDFIVIEVKWRATAAERDRAIDAYRLRRVAAAVEAVAHRYMRDGDNPRIDVLLLASGCWPRHIINAWQP